MVNPSSQENLVSPVAAVEHGRKRAYGNKAGGALPLLVPMNRRKRLFHMVFITIGEPQAHDDRLGHLRRICLGAVAIAW
jgi:hypothetical protein